MFYQYKVRYANGSAMHLLHIFLFKENIILNVLLSIFKENPRDNLNLYSSRLSQATDNNGFPGGARGKESTCQCKRSKRLVWSLGREDPLEKGLATHSCNLAWRIPWTEEPEGLQSIASQGVGQSSTQIIIFVDLGESRFLFY